MLRHLVSLVIPPITVLAFLVSAVALPVAVSIHQFNDDCTRIGGTVTTEHSFGIPTVSTCRFGTVITTSN